MAVATTTTIRPKAPGYLYGSLAMAMLLLVALIALTARQPPPPTIAEFAPQAVEKIEEAPDEQSSRFGTGDGGPGGFADTTTTTAAPDVTLPDGSPTTLKKTIDVARVRRCVGNPPRQIEDPQSPPCIQYFDGDNGGATHLGVTDREIRIAVPNYGDDKDLYRDLFEFFNRRFEFYGRKLVLVDASADIGPEPEKQNAKAKQVLEEYKAFASLDYFPDGGFVYHDRLAQYGIPSVTFLTNVTEQYLRERKPYIWQYPMGVDNEFAMTGEWICKRVANQRATFAGDPTFHDDTRKFGIIVMTYTKDNPLNEAPIRRELQKCGADTDVVFNFDEFGEGFLPESAANTMLQMRQNDVTSIICMCVELALNSLGQAASNQGYLPEWIGGSYFLTDQNWVQRNSFGLPKEQRAHLFGLTFRPRQLRVENSPWRWALKEVNPGSSKGNAASTSEVMYAGFRYSSLLLLASGIQMAGPNLTPQTFAAGLHRAQFPNPDHPNMAGKVGFAGGSQSMTIDAAEWWWSETEISPYADEGPGTICYVDDGKRYRKGEWPAAPTTVFSGRCSSGA